eukprot:scaffold46924_cov54-Attheya_sp.AAC.2
MITRKPFLHVVSWQYVGALINRHRREEIENRGGSLLSTKTLGKGEIPLVNEGDTFTIRDGYIGFTNNFRYLGSIINSDLRDIHKIKKRIQKATNQMHELTHLWRNKHIELGIKVWPYQSTLYCGNVNPGRSVPKPPDD